MPRPSFVETLESRIAPALVVVNPVSDIVASAGQTGVSVELGQIVDNLVAHPGHTLVKFTLNLDLDPNTAGIQNDTDLITPGIQPPTVVLELFDDEAPLTVANFLAYAQNPNTAADFLGTFFHRSVSNFVLQGGGYNSTAPTTHIDVFNSVHNEFSSDRGNVRGTVAMAKTGNGPNTATSEWFVNLADNRSNLDNQNGGFTVFGQIIDGMQYVDQIAALPTISVSTSSNLPVQNYASGSVGADNLITVTGVTVEKPTSRDITGQTFEVVSIVDPSTSGASTLVTSTFDSAHPSVLNLKYVDGKSGFADITVRVTKDGESVLDTFRVIVQPNLVPGLVSDSLPTIIVPGDTVTPTVKIINTGGADYTGKVTVKFYLSLTELVLDSSSGSYVVNPASYVVDSNDLLIRTFTGVDLTADSNGFGTITKSFALPSYLEKSDTPYRIIAVVEPTDGPAELFTDDNYSIDGALHVYSNQFGSFSINLNQFNKTGASIFPNQSVSRIGAKLTYNEPSDQNQVTLGITGSGGGRVTLANGLVNIGVAGTTSASILTLGTEARAELNNLEILSTIGTVDFSQADFTGFLTFSGGVKTLNLGNILGFDQTMLIGATSAANTIKATLNFGSVKDLNLESSQPIGSLTASEWLNTGGTANHISAYSLGILNINGGIAASGDLDADVNVSPKAAVTSITVKGTLNGATITTGGNIGTVNLGGMVDSSIFTGSNSLGDYVRRSSITNFTLGTLGFQDSTIATSSIGKFVSGAGSGPTQFSLTGSGDGRAEISASASGVDLTITHTTAASVFTFASASAQQLHDIHVDQSIGTLSFGKASVSGQIDFDGGAKTIVLGDIEGNEQTLNIGAFGALNTTKLNLTLGKVGQLNLTSAQPIGTLSALEWLDATGDANVITVPSLGSLVIKGGTGITGNLGASLVVSNAVSATNVSVKGTLQDSTLTSKGNFGTITLGGLTGSSIFAGSDALGEYLQRGTIGSLAITGTTFTDATIGTAGIGKLTSKGAIPQLALTGSGPGRAEISIATGGVDLTVSNTTGASIFTFTSPATQAIRDLQVDASIGTFSFAKASVSGDLDFTGGAKVITLGDLAGGERTLNIGAFTADNSTKLALTLGRVSELNLVSAQPLTSLTAVEWVDKSGANNTITAPSMENFTLKGATGKTAVAGDLEADIKLTQGLTSTNVSIKGTLKDSDIISPGNLGNVTLGGMLNSGLYSGSVANGDYLQRGVIRSLSITGTSLDEAVIAAGAIGKFTAKNRVTSLSLSGSGPGRAEFDFNGGALDLTLVNTDASSTFTFASSAAQTLRDLNVEQSIGTFSFAQMNATGTLEFAGGAKNLALGNIVGAERTLHLGAFVPISPSTDTSTTLTFGRVSELNLNSAQPITSLTAAEWLDGSGAANTIVAPSLKALEIKGSSTVRGDLEADVTLSDANVKLDTFKVAGYLHGATVKTPGNVGVVQLGAMTNASFFVGTDSRPDEVTDLTDKSIDNFTIKGGVLGAKASTVFLADAQIAARHISEILVKKVDGASGSGAFGIVADTIAKYTRDSMDPVINLDAPTTTVDTVGNYSVVIL